MSREKEFVKFPAANWRLVMVRSDYRDYSSFAGKIRIAFFFLGIIPYVLVVFMFLLGKISISEGVIYFIPLLLFTSLTGFSLLRRSADELSSLARETTGMDAGKKSHPIKIKVDKEINDIEANFIGLIEKLQKSDRDLREQSVLLMTYAKDLIASLKVAKEEEHLRRQLSRYVGNDLVERLINLNGEEFIENERRNITVLFADIRSFTSIAERMNPESLVSMLNEFFDVMANIIFKNIGVLDKFVGDQVVAVFGLISSEDNASSAAIKTAMEMQNRTEELMRARGENGKQTFAIGIGINTGSAVVGNIGSSNRMDFTVIGDCVNVAAKLQHCAKAGEIVIGEETFRQAPNGLPIEKKLRVKLKNRETPLVCYKISRQKGSSSIDSLSRVNRSDSRVKQGIVDL